MSGNLAVSTINGADISVSPVLNDTQLRSRLNATGTAPIYACRAWVNFNGTGAVAIRESGNVSSITDNGVGDYTVNFTTAMPDNNYSVSSTCGNSGVYNGDSHIAKVYDVPVANYIKIATLFVNNVNNAVSDFTYVNVQFYR